MPVNPNERVIINPIYDGVVMLSPDELLFNDAKPRPDGRKIYHIFERFFDEDYMDDKKTECFGHNSEEEFLSRRNELFLRASDTSFYNIQQILGKSGVSLEKWIKEQPSPWPPPSTVSPSSCSHFQEDKSQTPNSLSKLLIQNHNSNIQSNSKINSHILSSLPKSILVRSVKAAKEKETENDKVSSVNNFKVPQEVADDKKVSPANNFKVPQNFKKQKCKSLLITKSPVSLSNNQKKAKTNLVEPANKSYFEKLHSKRLLSPLATAGDTTTATTSSNNTTLTWKIRKADINEHRKRRKEKIPLEEEIKWIISQFNFSPEKSDPAHDNDPEETNENSESLKKYLLKNIKNFRKDTRSQSDFINSDFSISNSNQNSCQADTKVNISVPTLESKTSENLNTEIQIDKIKTEFPPDEMKLDNNWDSSENHLKFNDEILLKRVQKTESPSPPPINLQDADGECKEGNSLSKWIKSIKNREASTIVKFLPDKKKEVCLLSSNMKARKNSLGSQEIFTVEKKESTSSCYDQNSMNDIGMLQQENVPDLSVSTESNHSVCNSAYLYLENFNQEIPVKTEALPVIHHIGHEAQAEQKYLFENSPKEHFVPNAHLHENSTYQRAVDGLLSLNSHINNTQSFSQTPSQKFSAEENIPQNVAYINPEQHVTAYANQEQNSFDHYVNQGHFTSQQFQVNREIAPLHAQYSNQISNSTQLSYANEDQNGSPHLLLSNQEQNSAHHHLTNENSNQNVPQFVGYDNPGHCQNLGYSNFENNIPHNLNFTNNEQNSAQLIEYSNQDFMHNMGFEEKVKQSDPSYYNPHHVNKNFTYEQPNMVANYAETLANALGMTNRSISSAVDSNETCTQSYPMNGESTIFENGEIPETNNGPYNQISNINCHSVTQSENFNITSKKLDQNTIQNSVMETTYSTLCNSGSYDWPLKVEESKQYNSEFNCYAGKEPNNYLENQSYSDSKDEWHMGQNIKNMNILVNNNNNNNNNDNNNNNNNSDNIKMCDQVIRAMLNIDIKPMERFEDCNKNVDLLYNNESVANNNNNNNNEKIDVQSCNVFNNVPSISGNANESETVENASRVYENELRSHNCEREEDLEGIKSESEEVRIECESEDPKYEPSNIVEFSPLLSDTSELSVANEKLLQLKCTDAAIIKEQVLIAECEESFAKEDTLMTTKAVSALISDINISTDDDKISQEFLTDNNQTEIHFSVEEDGISNENKSAQKTVDTMGRRSATFLNENEEKSNGKNENRHGFLLTNYETVIKTECREEENIETPSAAHIEDIDTHLTTNDLELINDQMLQFQAKKNSLLKNGEAVEDESKIYASKNLELGIESQKSNSEVLSNKNCVLQYSVEKFECTDNIKLDNTQIFKKESKIPLIKAELSQMNCESESSFEQDRSFVEDSKNIKEMKMEDSQNNEIVDHFLTCMNTKSKNCSESLSSLTSGNSVDEVVKDEKKDVYDFNNELVNQLEVKPLKKEREEKVVVVKKSKDLIKAERENTPNKKIVLDGVGVEDSKEVKLTNANLKTPPKMERMLQEVSTQRSRRIRGVDLLRNKQLISTRRKRDISGKNSNKIVEVTEAGAESLIEEASRDLNLKKKLLIKSRRTGTRTWNNEKRGWFKIVKRKMDNMNNNNCNINSDIEKGFTKKNGIITKNTLYCCLECNYSTCKYNNLKRHQMSHLTVKRFKCSLCSYSSNFSSYLKEHSVIHSNQRPFKCSYCDFASKLKSNMKKHEKTHLKIPHRFSAVKDLCNIKDNGFNSKDSATMRKLKKTDVTVSMMEENRFNNLKNEQGDLTEIVKSKETSSQVPLNDTENVTEHCPSIRKENSVKKRKHIRNALKSLKNCKRVKENPTSANETQEGGRNFVSKKFICSECKLTSGIRRIIVRHVRQKHKGNETLISVVDVSSENYGCRKNLKGNKKPENEKKDLDANNTRNFSVNSLRNEIDVLHHDKNLSTTVKQNLVPDKTIQEQSPYEYSCDINQHTDLKTNCRVVIKLHKLSNLQTFTNSKSYEHSEIINQNEIKNEDTETANLDQEVHSQSLRLKYTERGENINEELTTEDKTHVTSSQPKRTNLRIRESVQQSSLKSKNKERSEESSNILNRDNSNQSTIRSGSRIKSSVKNKNRETIFNARNRKKIKLNVNSESTSELNKNINIGEARSNVANLESNLKDINREDNLLQIQKESDLIHNDSIQGILPPLPSGVSNNETTMTGNGEKDYPHVSKTNCGVLVANTYNANCDNISLYKHNDNILDSSNLSFMVSEMSGSPIANLNGNLNDRAENKLTLSPTCDKNISHSTSDSVTKANNLSFKLKQIRMLDNHVSKDEIMKGERMDNILSRNNVEFRRNLRSKPTQGIASDCVNEAENNVQQSPLKIESNLESDTSETNKLNVSCTQTSIISPKSEELSLKTEGKGKKLKTSIIPKSSTLNGENVSLSKNGTPFQEVKLFNCPHCSYSSNFKNFYEKHKKSHDKKLPPNKSLKKSKIQDGVPKIQAKYQCPHCAHSASTKAGLESHTVIHKTKDKNILVSKEKVNKLPQDIICKICKVTFTVKSSLYRHFKRKHDGINVNNEDDKKFKTTKKNSAEQVPKPKSCTLNNKCRAKKTNIKVPNKAPKLVQNRRKKK